MTTTEEQAAVPDEVAPDAAVPDEVAPDAAAGPGGAAGPNEAVGEAAPGEAAGDGESGAGESGAGEPGGPAGEGVAAPGRRRWGPPRGLPWPLRRIAAAAGVVVLLLTGGGLLLAARQLKDPGATANHALTDTAATSQVTGDVSAALSRIFAYTPDDTQSTAQAARDLLEGTAARQYQQLFGQIRQRVADQRLTLSTRVVRAGVVSLTGDRARLLVFLDQTAQRAGATPTSAAAQLSVTARLDGGHWRITDLKAR